MIVAWLLNLYSFSFKWAHVRLCINRILNLLLNVALLSHFLLFKHQPLRRNFCICRTKNGVQFVSGSYKLLVERCKSPWQWQVRRVAITDEVVEVREQHFHGLVQLPRINIINIVSLSRVWQLQEARVELWLNSKVHRRILIQFFKYFSVECHSLVCLFFWMRLGGSTPNPLWRNCLCLGSASCIVSLLGWRSLKSVTTCSNIGCLLGFDASWGCVVF